MRMTDDELAAAAEEFMPAEPVEDDDLDEDDTYQDDVRYEDTW